MISRLEHQFAGNLAVKSDFGEEFGELCLGFARAAFGHSEVSTNTSGLQKYTAKKVSMNVAAIFGFFLTLPISGLLTIAGTISLALSNTHAEKYSTYAQEVLKKSQ